MANQSIDKIPAVGFEWKDDQAIESFTAQQLDEVLTGTISLDPLLNAYTTMASPSVVMSNTISAGNMFNGTISVPVINIKSENGKAMIETSKHDIDVDKLYEDVKDLKQVLVALANDSDLLERNPIIRDILADWLIKGLTK
jgi:hypothetical protein